MWLRVGGSDRSGLKKEAAAPPTEPLGCGERLDFLLKAWESFQRGSENDWI